MNAQDLAITAAILFIAGVAKGATGIGMPVVGVPLLSTVITVKRAISLITLPLVITNIAQALEGGQIRNELRRLVFPVLGFVPGCLLGFEILFRSDEHTAKTVAGLMLVLAAALTALTRRGAHFWSRTYTKSMGSVAGVSAGLIAGMSGVAGPPVFIYLLGFDPKPKEFTKSVAIFLIAANLVMALALMNGSHMDRSDVLNSLLATVPVFIGMLIGQRLRDGIPVPMFRKIVLVFVFAAGLQLTYRGIAT